MRMKSSCGSGNRSTRRQASTETPSTSSISREEIDEVGAHERDGELVDRDPVALLEHVDAHDVGAEPSDARRDRAERSGPVGEPDPHEEPGRDVLAGSAGNGSVGHEGSVGATMIGRVRPLCGGRIAAV